MVHVNWIIVNEYLNMHLHFTLPKIVLFLNPAPVQFILLWVMDMDLYRCIHILLETFHVIIIILYYLIHCHIIMIVH